MKRTDTMNIRPQLQRACGIDIHKDKVSVCYYISGEMEEVKEYGTFTCDLEQIRDALQKYGIKDAIMESTGVYWIALCSLLTAAGIEVRVVNARFVKNMPKEKTDKKDAKWLCKLLVNTFVRASFVVKEDQRAFRDLCRMRIKYTQHITQSQRIVYRDLQLLGLERFAEVIRGTGVDAVDCGFNRTVRRYHHHRHVAALLARALDELLTGHAGHF